MVHEFLAICKRICCPIAMEKTEWPDALMVFLGMLLDGKRRIIAIPMEKKIKAIKLLNYAIQKKKVKIKFIQQLTGTLNFLNKAIVWGRAFTRGMYSKLALVDKKGNPLKQQHHVYLKQDFLLDCRVWLSFLANADPKQLCRPFIDFDPNSDHSVTLSFYSDASKNPDLGFGAIFDNRWIMQR